MIYLTSDLHFGHFKIIEYCDRPFKTVKDMNDTLINNWNSVVGDSDIIYVIGDFGFTGSEHYLLDTMNGKIVLIKGSHDRFNRYKDVIPFLKKAVLGYWNYEFLLVHNPKNRGNWKGWMISGHVHNSDLKNYPLVHHQNKTINVSCELTNYTPISIEEIIRRIENENNYVSKH